MKISKLIYTLPLILLLSSFYASSNFIQIENKTEVLKKLKTVSQNTSTITATFTEEKFIAAFKNPQITNGTFYYTDKGQMRWEQKKPYEYIILINGKKLRIKDNGKEKEITQGGRMTAKVNEFMMSLIQGNYQDSKIFTTSGPITEMFRVPRRGKSNWRYLVNRKAEEI